MRQDVAGPSGGRAIAETAEQPRVGGRGDASASTVLSPSMRFADRPRLAFVICAFGAFAACGRNPIGANKPEASADVAGRAGSTGADAANEAGTSGVAGKAGAGGRAGARGRAR